MDGCPTLFQLAGVCGASIYGQGTFFLHNKLAAFGICVEAALHGLQCCLAALRCKFGEQLLAFGIYSCRYAGAVVGVVKHDFAGAAAFAVARLQGHLSGSLL